MSPRDQMKHCLFYSIQWKLSVVLSFSHQIESRFVCRIWSCKTHTVHIHTVHWLTSGNQCMLQVDSADAHSQTTLTECCKFMPGIPNSYSFCVHHSVNFELQVSEIYQLEIFRQKWAWKMQLWCNVCLKNCSVRYLETMQQVKNGSLVNLVEHKNQLQSVFMFVQLWYSVILFFPPYRSQNCDIHHNFHYIPFEQLCSHQSSCLSLLVKHSNLQPRQAITDV